jgi:predicted TIM-barrel fold metal-dependent hydrolase
VSDVALIERADELLAAQGAQIAAILPEGCEPFDAHTHLGLDIDGHALSVAEHLALMDGAGVCGANVFALNEPDQAPAYRAPNDRVLAWAAEAPDRLFPFVRLSLDEDPLGEAVRCLDRGARGIKLHPRAQSFAVDDPRLDAVFALAHERKVPVLIHAGRGLPPGMPLQLGRVAERFPDASLILAHAAIVAQAGVGELARSVENIFFDSSTWTPLDQLNLMSLVPPEQILWASDIPYGEPLAALNVFARAARVSGAGDDLLRGMLRDNALGLLEGRRPATRSAPLAAPVHSISYPRIRATMYLAGATSLLFMGLPERVGYLGLAAAALHEEGLDDLAELVCCTAALWEQWAATIVPGAPPDLAARGRVWRLLNQAQANIVLA